MRYLFLLLLVFASCGHTPEKTVQTLRLNLADDPASFDPRIARSLKDLTLVKQLYEGLMRLDSDGNPQPAIAEKVDLSDDLLTYTFHLRNAEWTNGKPVTAYDFEYAWKTVLDPTFATDYAHMLYPIKNAKARREGKCDAEDLGIRVEDEKTLIIQLEAPTPYFLELTAFPTYFPILDEAYNGPFKLQKWSPQSELQLVKNPSYWDQKNVRLNALVFSIITDNNTERHLFEKNKLDWLGQPISHNISTESVNKIKERKSYNVAGTFWFKFNTEKTPFNLPEVRRAFAYAINRKEIIEHILQGNQIPATGPLPPSMQLQTEPYFIDGDIKLAQQLFEEALTQGGWTRKTFPKIILNYPPSERNTKIVQLVQQQWREALGIEVKLVAVENQLYRRNVLQGLYQVGTGDWIADFNDPLAFLELFKFRNQDGNGMNDTGWYHALFSRLLDQSLVECDPVQRKKLLQQAEKILVDEMPIAPIYHYAFDYVRKDYVKNVILSPLGTADFKLVTIE